MRGPRSFCPEMRRVLPSFSFRSNPIKFFSFVKRGNFRVYRPSTCEQCFTRATIQPFQTTTRRFSTGNKKTKTQFSSRTQKKNSKVGLWLAATVLGVVGLSYASVPLYRIFCQVTGYGGTVKEFENKASKDYSILAPTKNPLRPLRIHFISNVSDALPWRFTPNQKVISLTPGETMLAFYTAENFSNDQIVGIAAYNVTPARAYTLIR